jgi:hypothetical protein
MTPEEELMDVLQREFAGNAITIEASSTQYFSLLQARFPMRGAKIDWDRLTTAKVRRVHTSNGEQYINDAMMFARETIETEQLDLTSQVVAIGDSAMDKSLKMPISTLLLCLPNIVAMPQHTYILATDASWCLAFTMEGDLCFGFAPS